MDIVIYDENGEEKFRGNKLVGDNPEGNEKPPNENDEKEKSQEKSQERSQENKRSPQGSRYSNKNARKKTPSKQLWWQHLKS